MAFAQRLQPAFAGSDEKLVAQLRAGDDEAFAALYRRYAQLVRGYLLRMLDEPGRVEDLTQEVFLAAVRRLRATDAPVMFKPWIYEIAHNAALDEFRRRRRRPEVPLKVDPDAALSSGGLTSRAETPEGALEDKQRLEDLRGAFQGLSERHHRVLVLRELEGRSYAEIGQQLNMSGEVVESTLFRARRKLTDEYRELSSGQRCELVQSAIELGSAELRKLGLRRSRVLSRHLAHCQPCRRSAHEAGVFDDLVSRPRRSSRLGALLGIPWLRLRGGRADHGSAARIVGAAPNPGWLGSLSSTLAPFGGLSRGMAAGLAAVVAGIGGGAAVVASHSGKPRPRPARAVQPRFGAAAPLASPPTTRRFRAGVRPSSRRHQLGPAAAAARPASASPATTMTSTRVASGSAAQTSTTPSVTSQTAATSRSGSASASSAGPGSLNVAGFTAAASATLSGTGAGLLGTAQKILGRGVAGVAGRRSVPAVPGVVPGVSRLAPPPGGH